MSRHAETKPPRPVFDGQADSHRFHHEPPAPQRSLLSRAQILRHRDEGNIIIHPFNEVNLGNTSYDVRLGKNFFREQFARGGNPNFNPFSEADVHTFWGAVEKAVDAETWMQKSGELQGIRPEDRLIIINPGETILAHTFEFIGGLRCVATEMKARSSMGRVGITVCKCASWGSVDYFSRWTMEITNHLKETSIPLPVGMRIAQIIFNEVDPVEERFGYSKAGGKYQSDDDLAEVISKWDPYSMLPRLHADPDVGSFHEYHKLPPLKK